jgi:hypothetical protein
MRLCRSVRVNPIFHYYNQSPHDVEEMYEVLLRTIRRSAPSFQLVRVSLTEGARLLRHTGKPMERQALVQAVLAGNLSLANREIRGVVERSSRNLFERTWIAELGKRAPHDFQYQPNVLWMAIDPAGGGNCSDFAMATIGFEHARHIVVGLDSTSNVKHNGVVEMIEGHLKCLRSIPKYKDAVIMVSIERNYGGGFVVDTVKKIVCQQQFMPIEIMSYDKSNSDKEGVWLDQPVKEAMSGMLQRSVADGLLCFAVHFVTTRKNFTEIQTEIREQMANYREELLRPKDLAVGITKKWLTGKTGSGRKDDLLIVVMLALYFANMKRMESTFRAKAQRFGWRI